MSLALSSDADAAFVRALETHVKTLSAEELQDFIQISSGPHAVLETIKELDTRHLTSSRARRCLSRLNTWIKPFEEYFSVVETMVSANPTIAALVWGGIKCVLKIVHRITSLFEKVTDALDNIGNMLYFFRRYTVIYRGQPRVQEVLVSVYAEMLSFFCLVRTLFKGKSSLALLIHGFIKHGQMDSAITRLIRRRDTLREEVEHGDREHGHADRQLIRGYMITHREEMLARERHQEREEKERRRDAILAKLTIAEMDDEYNQHISATLPGSGEWFIKHPIYSKWLHEHPQKILWCHGKPGSGKTVLASLFVRKLLEEDHFSVAFFYCALERSAGKIVLQSLLHQLARKLSPDLNIWANISMAYRGSMTIGLEPTQKLLLEVSVAVGPAFLVIDGLDECKASDQEIVLNALGNLTQSFRIVIFSRDEPEIRRLMKSPVEVTLGSESNRDITEFVMARVSKLVDQRSLDAIDPSLRDSLVKSILDKANGMFLWVVLQLAAIAEESTVHDIREALLKLPADLNETYTRILQKIYHLRESRTRHATRLLTWLACAPRALTLDDVAAATTIHDMVNGWDHQRVPGQPLPIIQDCFGLVVLEEPGARTSEYLSAGLKNASFVPELAHYSVQEFLCSDPQRDPLRNRLQLFPSSLAHMHLTHACVSIIRHQSHAPTSLWKYAAGHWPDHFIAAMSPSDIHLLQVAQSLNSEGLNDLLHDLASLWMEDCWKYALSGYGSLLLALNDASIVKGHDMNHACSFCLLLLLKARRSYLDNSGDHPAGIIIPPEATACPVALRLSCAAGDLNLSRELLRGGYILGLDAQSTLLPDALCRLAVRHAHDLLTLREILEYSAGLILQDRGEMAYEAVSEAVQYCNRKISDHERIGASFALQGCPLYYAVTTPNPNIAFVRFLLECGADPNTRNTHGDTVLHGAISLCEKEDVLSILVQSRYEADRYLVDEIYSETPYERAVRLHRPVNIRRLVIPPADQNGEWSRSFGALKDLVGK